MLSFVVLSLVALLPFVTAQVGECSATDVGQYFAALPNAAACGQAGLTLVTDNPSDDAYDAALDTFCTVDCGGQVAKFYLQTCEDLVAGVLSFLTCLPREMGDDRCGNSLPSRINSTVVDNLLVCANFNNNECPEGCEDALTVGVREIGCCYRSLYNDSDLITVFTAFGLLTEQDIVIINALKNPALWSACNVDIPDYCTGEPFPGESVLQNGICTETQVNNFFADLSDSCSSNFGKLFMNPNAAELDAICDQNCAGKFADFLDEQCVDPFGSTITEAACFKTEGSTGDRCLATLAEEVTTPVFENIGNACFSSEAEECPTGCSQSLTAVSNLFGCCYQSIYNNTDTLDLLLFNEEVSLEERVFFGVLGDRTIWDACDVPLIRSCGDPFADDGPSGAAKFVASTIILVIGMVMPFIL